MLGTSQCNIGRTIMTWQHGQRDWSRRDLLGAGCTLAGTLGAGGLAAAAYGQSKDEDGPYGPFKMGLQSYSLRGYTRNGRPDLRKALEVTRQLGVRYWESYPDHVPMGPGARAGARIKAQLDQFEVKVIGYGVVRFTKNAEANRRIFEFARAMGMEYLSADPDPDALGGLDKLLETHEVALGIHNHGPGHRYARIETIAKTIADHHPRLGCCIDTGHFLRSREDPVAAVEAFGKRIYGVHLKDVKDAATFTVLGKGDLRTVDFLKGLLRNKYAYCLAIEYEEKPEDPVADIKECLGAARKAIALACKA
jgi:sugar phosphate isomerase/epimerase